MLHFIIACILLFFDKGIGRKTNFIFVALDLYNCVEKTYKTVYQS